MVGINLGSVMRRWRGKLAQRDNCQEFSGCCLVPQGRIELPTSPLPRVRSTTELLRRSPARLARAPRYSPSAPEGKAPKPSRNALGGAGRPGRDPFAPRALRCDARGSRRRPRAGYHGRMCEQEKTTRDAGAGSTTSSGAAPGTPPGHGRRERAAAALRANLRRRKQAQRRRPDEPGGG